MAKRGKDFMLILIFVESLALLAFAIFISTK